ncbi:MAG: hypothetical protein QNJ81_14555, partial [Acidimicrobiia bacterium]|nr:hypothetical protein [Acidimicrobiia bacterium]
MVPPVLTRLDAPPLPESMLTRRRLNRLLSRAHRKSLILVKAPAGWGKTVAVADWVRRHEANDRFVWLTIENEDNEPRRFWLSLVEAVATVEPTAATDVRRRLNAGSARNGHAMSTEFVNGLHSSEEPITIVLDDFEKISNPDVTEWLAFVIRAMPPTVRFVLCTRREPDLPLSAWRAKGRLAEITREDLRFTDEEAGAYLDPLIAGALSQEQESELLEKTQGWIAALHLAALGTQHAPDIAVFIDTFGGGHEALSHYVVDDALASLPEGMQSFLTRTSIVRTMSASVCDAITDRTDSAAMLRALVKHDMFVAASPSTGRWSYHPLFREVLRDLLAETVDEQEMADLHRRAAGSYLADGDVAAALDHTFAANDWDLTRRILNDHHRELMHTNPKALLATLARMHEGSLLRWPRGRSMQIAAATILADTDTLLAIAGREAIHGARTFELVARSMLSYLEGNYVDLEATLPRSSKGMHPVARPALLGLIETANERYESGATVLHSAAAGQSIEDPATTAITGILAWNQVRAGLLNVGAAYARRALSFADTHGTRWIHWVRWAELAQANARFDRGQLDDALVEATSIAAGPIGDGWSHVEAHLLAARVNWSLGNRGAVSEHLAKAAVGPRGPVSGHLAQLIALTNARICLLDGDIELAEAWLPDWRARAAAGPNGEHERLVLARLLIESDQFAESLDLLQDDGGDSSRSFRYLVEAKKLRAIVASRSGDPSAPLLLEAAVSA